MRTLNVKLDLISETNRLNEMKYYPNIRTSMIRECILTGGIFLTPAGDIALTDPFVSNRDFIFSYNRNTICSGEIVESPEERFIYFNFHPTLRMEKYYNLAMMKSVQIQIMEYNSRRDNFGTYTDIRSARLIPDINEIQLIKKRELNRSTQPSVMLI